MGYLYEKNDQIVTLIYICSLLYVNKAVENKIDKKNQVVSSFFSIGNLSLGLVIYSSVVECLHQSMGSPLVPQKKHKK
jgi:hypothetical protein